MEIIVQIHKMSICVLSLAWQNKLELLLKKKKQTKALVEHSLCTQKGHHVGFVCKENMHSFLINFNYTPCEAKYVQCTAIKATGLIRVLPIFS